MAIAGRGGLSWKPPQGAESSGSKGVRGQGSGGGPGHVFLVPKASVQGLSCLSYVVAVSRPWYLVYQIPKYWASRIQF